jgi:quercetin dioxygenase-like cupin family protein
LWPRATLGRADRRNAPGDVIIIAPNEKHWHGAAPTTAMTHIAIQESLDGNNVDWLEKVTDEQYQPGPAS